MIPIFNRMTGSPRLALIMSTLVSCIAFDQASKALVRALLPRNEAFSYAGGVFRLYYAENTGAFLSLGSSLPDGARGLIFTVGTGILVVTLLVWLIRATRMGPWNTLAISLVCAGGIGNLIDRVRHDGRVIDFLNLGLGGLRTGIFNVADMAITAGVLMFLADGIMSARRRAG